MKNVKPFCIFQCLSRGGGYGVIQWPAKGKNSSPYELIAIELQAPQGDIANGFSSTRYPSRVRVEEAGKVPGGSPAPDERLHSAFPVLRLIRLLVVGQDLGPVHVLLLWLNADWSG